MSPDYNKQYFPLFTIGLKMAYISKDIKNTPPPDTRKVVKAIRYIFGRIKNQTQKIKKKKYKAIKIVTRKSYSGIQSTSSNITQAIYR